MVEIHLYGKLRRFGDQKKINEESIIKIKPERDDTIDTLLLHAGIPLDDIYHIFYNWKLLSTRNSMAEQLGYRQERSDPFNWDLDVQVTSGDRIGLFGSDMAALVI